MVERFEVACRSQQLSPKICKPGFTHHSYSTFSISTLLMAMWAFHLYFSLHIRQHFLERMRFAGSCHFEFWWRDVTISIPRWRSRWPQPNAFAKLELGLRTTGPGAHGDKVYTLVNRFFDSKLTRDELKTRCSFFGTMSKKSSYLRAYIFELNWVGGGSAVIWPYCHSSRTF